MTIKNKEMDKLSFSYSTNNNPLEEENAILKETVHQLRDELVKLKTPPLMVSTVKDITQEGAVIQIPNGNEFFVNVIPEEIKPGDSVLVEQKNLNIVKKIPSSKKFMVENFVIMEKPEVGWEKIGGLKNQIREIQEVVELPLIKPYLFKKIGISPPKGVLLHGPPGTGKTLLAKAVASSTNSTFIQIVASELVQKFIGEGAKMVKELFELAREKAPAIIFIDELDALASNRIEIGTSGEREVQRTFMQLLAEVDGFKPLDNVKIIGATNRKDILDPAVIRPGRLDRLIYCPVPDKDGITEIFNIHSSSMKLDDSVNLSMLVSRMEEFSGAEIKAACTEAGYFAIRANRGFVTHEDFLQAIEKVKRKEQEDNDYKQMFV